MVDYNKVKTPFFEISVGPSTAKDSDMIILPPQLHKLVEKVEILESVTTETCFTSKISITFIEGSREPFSPISEAKTEEIYGSEALLTNSTGMLLDLRFIEQGGEIKLFSKAADVVGQAQQLVATGIDLFSGDDTEVFEAKKDPESVTFLFQERNRINVTWGYIEDRKNARTIRGYITVVQSNFPENDQPSVTLTCLTGEYALDQLSSGTGIQFFNSTFVGLAEDGITDLENFNGLTVSQILEKFRDDWGIGLTVSEKFINNSPAAERAIVLTPDKSPAEFIRDLAKQVNAVVEFRIDGDGKDHLVFLSREDFNGLILNDINALTYKAPGSILKSVSILADYGKVNGYKGSYIDNEGQLRSSEAQFDDTTEVRFIEGEQESGQLDTNPTSNNPINAAKEFQNKTSKSLSTTPSTKIHPRTEDKASLIEQSKAKSSRCNTTLVTVEFTAYGYPLIRPGAAVFRGLGNRFSGLYSIINVTHTLDVNGYTIRGNAKTNSIFEGGVKLPGGKKINLEKETKVRETIIESAANSFNKISDPSKIGESSIESASNESPYEKYSKLQLS